MPVPRSDDGSGALRRRLWPLPLPARLTLLAVIASVAALSPWALALRPQADLIDLLPDGAPEAEAWLEWAERFGGAETVFVMITAGADASESVLDLVPEVTSALARTPGVRSVRSGLTDADERFLLEAVAPRAALLLPAERFPAALEERLDPERLAERARLLAHRLRLPGQEWRRELLVRDPLGLVELLPGFDPSAADLPIDPLTGNFLSADGRSTLLLLRTEASDLDPAAGERLWRRLGEIDRQLEARGATLHAVGGPLYAAQDEATLRGDLVRTVATSVLGCTLLLLLVFGSWREPLAVLIPVLCGLCATAALLQLTGGVSAVALGFAAVIVGLGIDYGIHAAARFRDEARASPSAIDALTATWRACGPAIVVSALTTALAFLVLIGAHLPPLRDVGRTVAVGILAILFFTWLAGGSLLVLSANRGRAGRSPLWTPLQRGVDAAVGLGVARPVAVLTVAGLVTLLAVPGILRLRLDADPRSLRPADSPTLEAERRLAREFGLGYETATVVVEAPSVAAVLERARTVAAELRAGLAERGVEATVSSPSDWLVGERVAAERLDRLAGSEMADALPVLERELRRAGLAPRAFEPGLSALRALAAGRDPLPANLPVPAWIAGQLSEGSPAAAAISVRHGEDELVWGADEPLAAIVVGLEGTRLVSASRLGGAIQRVAASDLRRLVVLAGGAVALTVLVGFRLRPGPAVAALVPVTLGSCWGLGLWGWLDGRLDLMALAVVPIVLGIGIDDGLHAIHGALRRADLGTSVREAGRAMSLTTLTTAIGFASLTTSAIPGLRRAGLLVALAVVCCLLATLVVLPTGDRWRRRG